MDISSLNLINCVIVWLLVLLAITGYFVTLRKTGEKWHFWVTLATGWALLAITETLMIAGVTEGTWYVVTALWSPFVLVMASLTLIFIKLPMLTKLVKLRSPVKKAPRFFE
jgi:hypothetical protein